MTTRVFAAALTSLVVLFGAAGDLAAAADGRIAVAMLDDARVAVVNASDGQEIGSFKTGPGPRSILLHEGRLYIANRGVEASPGSSITVADAEAIKALKTVRVCDGCAPRSLAFDSNGRLWMSGQAHRAVYWLEAPYSYPAGSILVDWSWPTEVVVIPDSDLVLVGYTDGDQLASIDPNRLSSGRVSSIKGPSMLAVRPGTAEVWVASEASDGLMSKSVDQNGKIGWQAVGKEGFVADLQFSADGRLAFVASIGEKMLKVFDARAGTLLGSLDLGDIPGNLAVAADGRAVAVHVPYANQIVLVDTSNPGSPTRSAAFDFAGAVGDMLWLR